MSDTQNTRPFPPSAYMSVDLGAVAVRPIGGHPSHYVVAFGEFGDLRIHLTPEQWDEIDAAVRAGFAAAAAPAVAS